MSIEYIVGDLFDSIENDKPTVIAHVCNDQGAWGAGFVVPLGMKYPIARNAYLAWHKEGVWTPELENQFTGSSIEGGYDDFKQGLVQLVKINDNLYVANMVAQNLGGRRPLNYLSLAKCLGIVNDTCQGFDILCPRFGAGLAGGDWYVIECLIQDTWKDMTIKVFEREQDRGKTTNTKQDVAKQAFIIEKLMDACGPAADDILHNIAKQWDEKQDELSNS